MVRQMLQLEDFHLQTAYRLVDFRLQIKDVADLLLKYRLVDFHLQINLLPDLMLMYRLVNFQIQRKLLADLLPTYLLGYLQLRQIRSEKYQKPLEQVEMLKDQGFRQN